MDLKSFVAARNHADTANNLLEYNLRSWLIDLRNSIVHSHIFSRDNYNDYCYIKQNEDICIMESIKNAEIKVLEGFWKER